MRAFVIVEPEEACQRAFELIAPGAEFLARSVERSSVLTGTIGEDPLERPVCFLIERHQDLPEEAGRLSGRSSGDDPGRGVGAGGITGRELPDLADALPAPAGYGTAPILSCWATGPN